MARSGYTGRFAPSPTGPLHLGSLVAAAASFLDARAQGGRWLVRMEDADEPRCSRAHADTILRQLEACGFEWDGPVVFQSDRQEAYHAALARLQREHKVFACACTRRELGGGEFYPGTCRDGLPPGREGRSWRLRIDGEPITFDDRWLGPRTENLRETTGDFVLLRADGLFAYQLAVVVDDAWQDVTDVVRGEDLLGSTARQIFLQRQLSLPSVRYLHVPVVTGENGQKLSKQTHAPAAGAGDLPRALQFLGLTAGSWADALDCYRQLPQSKGI